MRRFGPDVLRGSFIFDEEIEREKGRERVDRCDLGRLRAKKEIMGSKNGIHEKIFAIFM